MRKLFFISALALLGLCSCENETVLEQEVPQPKPVTKVTLNLNVQTASSGQTKAVKTGWAEGDNLYLLLAQGETLTKEGAKRVIVTYNADNEWEVTDGQEALNEIDGDGLLSGAYLSGGAFQWSEEEGVFSVEPSSEETHITELQMSVDGDGNYKAGEYTFSDSTITATITLKQAGMQISISNMGGGSNWRLTAPDTGYQEMYAAQSVSFTLDGETISSQAVTSDSIPGRAEGEKVVFYGIPTGDTKKVQLTVTNSETGFSYTKYFPVERTLQVGQAISVKGPQLDSDGSFVTDNGWLWNEDPVTSVITYTTSDGQKLPLPSSVEGQIEMFGAPVNSHEYAEKGTIIFRGIVTKIGDSAFKKASTLQTMEISNHVQSIGASAFSGCSKLSSINLPEGLQSIGSHAFENCQVLDGISLPSTLTSIGDYAFYWCKAISGTLTVPDGITALEEGVFFSCEKITQVNLPEGLQSIGASAFWQCYALSSINLPEGLLSIGQDAFNECTVLDGISLPSTLTFIGAAAFGLCSALSNLTVPDGVTALEEAVFALCSNLTEINLPETLETIGECVFMDCSSLTSITIPGGVTSIGNQAFDNLTLNEIAFKSASPPEGLSEYTFMYASVKIIYVPSESVDAYKAVLGSYADYVQEF